MPETSQLLVLGLSGPELTGEEEVLFRKLQPGGFILFSRNIETPAQTRTLTDQLRSLSTLPPLIAIDNEGGRVWRTAAFGTSPPSAAEISHAGDPQLASLLGYLTGRLLRQVGIYFNLAPVLDLDDHPGEQKALRGRCWGNDTHQVIALAGLCNRFQRKQGILGCGKHFPAGGRARVDPHHELPVVDASLEDLLARDLIPYTALMPELDAVLLAHIHFSRIDPDAPGLPSSLSRAIATRLLRDQLGYEGLVLTDDLDMGAIQKAYGTPAAARTAVLAGVDQVLLCHEFLLAGETLAALRDIPPAIVHDCVSRIDKARWRVADTLSFDEGQMQILADEFAQLRSDVPALGEDGSNSPVEAY